MSGVTERHDTALLARLAGVLPQAALLTGTAIGPRYQEDLRNRHSAPPRFVLRPGTTGEGSPALASCHQLGPPLARQGGRTGLSGGHRVQTGEAVLSRDGCPIWSRPIPTARPSSRALASPCNGCRRRRKPPG
ncbi:MAG: hypothetical protein ACK5IP_16245 [Paracoccus sp. (in: a-proteobacteria)]